MLFLFLAPILTTTALDGAPSVPADHTVPGPGIVYRNAQYGFCFTLPASWRGYRLIWEKWEGGRMNGLENKPNKDPKILQGPKLSIRNPNWTQTNHYEDIPIMIFTRWQWKLAKDYIFSPAPIGPSELGRNRRYVFALPARYNYDFATGWEEVDKQIRGGALQAPCQNAAVRGR